MTLIKWGKLNGKVIDMIGQWIHQYVYHLVCSKTLTYNLLKRLSKVFIATNFFNETFFIKKIINSKYKTVF